MNSQVSCYIYHLTKWSMDDALSQVCFSNQQYTFSGAKKSTHRHRLYELVSTSSRQIVYRIDRSEYLYDHTAHCSNWIHKGTQQDSKYLYLRLALVREQSPSYNLIRVVASSHNYMQLYNKEFNGLAIPAPSPRPSAWIMPRIRPSVIIILNFCKNLSAMPLYSENKSMH